MVCERNVKHGESQEINQLRFRKLHIQPESTSFSQGTRHHQPSVAVVVARLLHGTAILDDQAKPFLQISQEAAELQVLRQPRMTLEQRLSGDVSRVLDRWASHEKS